MKRPYSKPIHKFENAEHVIYVAEVMKSFVKWQFQRTVTCKNSISILSQWIRFHDYSCQRATEIELTKYSYFILLEAYWRSEDTR